MHTIVSTSSNKTKVFSVCVHFSASEMTDWEFTIVSLEAKTWQFAAASQEVSEKKVLIRESVNFDTRVKSQVPCYMHFPFVSLRFIVGVFLEINFGGLVWCRKCKVWTWLKVSWLLNREEKIEF